MSGVARSSDLAACIALGVLALAGCHAIFPYESGSVDVQIDHDVGPGPVLRDGPVRPSDAARDRGEGPRSDGDGASDGPFPIPADGPGGDLAADVGAGDAPSVDAGCVDLPGKCTTVAEWVVMGGYCGISSCSKGCGVREISCSYSATGTAECNCFRCAEAVGPPLAASIAADEAVDSALAGGYCMPP